MHNGVDGRRYIIDTARVFPPEFMTPHENHRMKMARLQEKQLDETQELEVGQNKAPWMLSCLPIPKNHYLHRLFRPEFVAKVNKKTQKKTIKLIIIIVLCVSL